LGLDSEGERRATLLLGVSPCADPFDCMRLCGLVTSAEHGRSFDVGILPSGPVRPLEVARLQVSPPSLSRLVGSGSWLVARGKVRM
jgi:hypothetical protein